METIKARYNWGRWIWDCPECNAGNKINPGEYMAFCGECYPDKRARKEATINGVLIRGYDKRLQDLAKRRAWGDDRVYKISFPRNHKQIEDVLRCRIEKHASWEPEETLEDLLKENEILGYKAEVKEEKKPVEKPKAPPELDDDTLRSIF